MQKQKRAKQQARLLDVPGSNQVRRSDVSNQAPLVYHSSTWYCVLVPFCERWMYIGQTASTLTSRLQRTSKSRRAAALAFALVTRSVRKRNRVKGTLVCTLRRAHRLSTGPMRHNLGYFGI